jgi:hypothetical protein
VPTQPSFDSLTRSKAGGPGAVGAVLARGRLWVPAFAGTTEKKAGTKCQNSHHKPRAGTCGRLTDGAVSHVSFSHMLREP